MKKVLVLSDSHGNIDNMIYAIMEENPDMIIHLGDCMADVESLIEEIQDIPVENVPGNCDFCCGSQEKVLEINGVRVLICHGHTYNVKNDYYRIQMAAMEKGVDIAMFGHTHRVFYNHHNGIRLFNPGSIGAPGYGCSPSYGILVIDKKKGILELDVEYID